MSQPGFARQSQYRTVFRVLAVVLGVAAVACFVRFGILISRELAAFDNHALDGSSDAGLAPMGWFLGGGVAMVLAAVCANLGFMGAAARYGAGETMPVVKDSAAYLSDGEGILGVGRTVDDTPAGPYCRQCGKRGDADARFCDGCGQSLPDAPA